MEYNKKVKNATKLMYDGLNFDSKLEMFCYKYFKDNNITLLREPITLQLLPSFISTVKLYLPEKKTKNKSVTMLKERLNKKILPITYKPDFILNINKTKTVIIEVKGKPNDVYPYKRKLLMWLLEHNKQDQEYWFFEPHNQTQIKQMFNIIKTLYE